MTEMDEVGEIRLPPEDPVAIEGLVAGFFQPLKAFFLRRVADTQKAENLLQETMLRMTRSFHRLRPGPTVRSWAFAVAANLYRDFLRDESRAPIPESGLDDRLSTAPGPEQVVLDRDVQQAFARSIEALPEKHRLVFLLKHEKGMTYLEIGRTLNISEGTAKSRMHTATLLVRERLARQGYLQGAPGGGTR